MYKINNTPRANNIVRINEDGTISFIPLNENNTDYQAYLAWVEEGNTAEEWSAE
jgi:hypothetical protein